MIRVRINPQTCLFHEYFHTEICLTIKFCGFRDEAEKISSGLTVYCSRLENSAILVRSPHYARVR